MRYDKDRCRAENKIDFYLFDGSRLRTVGERERVNIRFSLINREGKKTTIQCRRSVFATRRMFPTLDPSCLSRHGHGIDFLSILFLVGWAADRVTSIEMNFVESFTGVVAASPTHLLARSVAMISARLFPVARKRSKYRGHADIMRNIPSLILFVFLSFASITIISS